MHGSSVASGATTMPTMSIWCPTMLLENQEPDQKMPCCNPFIPARSLLQDFMRPHLIGVDELSSVVGVPPTQIVAVLDGKRAITADAAFGLGSFLGTTTELWLNLQRDHDMQLAETAKLEAIDRDAKAPI
jgi:addiction module HigA family antidote